MKNILLSYSYYETESFFVANLQQELEHNGNQVKSIMESTKDSSNAGEIIPDYINGCNLVIAILGDGSNVFYDLGYAMSKNNKILLVSDGTHVMHSYLDTIPDIVMRNNNKNLDDDNITISKILNFVKKIENDQIE
jgi:hypothetical protein